MVCYYLAEFNIVKEERALSSLAWGLEINVCALLLGGSSPSLPSGGGV